MGQTASPFHIRDLTAARQPDSLAHVSFISQPSTQPRLPASDSEHWDRWLAGLVQHRWGRLRFEYADPLAVLHNEGARQWTLGWLPQSAKLILLCWECHSFEAGGTWRIYENGRLVFDEADHLSKSRHALLNQLLESEQLPFVTPAQLIAPLQNLHQLPDWGRAAAQALSRTILAHPDIFSVLKPALFQALEADLNNPNWPVLDIQKIGRVAQKNRLVAVFAALLESASPPMQGILSYAERRRLQQALEAIQSNYYDLSRHTGSIVRPMLEHAYNEFRLMMTSGHWRTRI